MLRQFVIAGTSSGKFKIDLVKGSKTKARIYRVVWDVRLDTNFQADFQCSALLSSRDFETYLALADVTTDRRAISQVTYINEVITTGIGLVITTSRDDLIEHPDVVAPITLNAIIDLGTVIPVCRIYYEILPASNQEII